LLGRQQHGHINAVGFDLYTKMLERSVAELKGETAAPELRVTINLGVDVRIPPEYIPSENLRLRTYKRIAEMPDEGPARGNTEGIGRPVWAAAAGDSQLAGLRVAEALAERLLVASIDRRGPQVAIKFHHETPVKPERLVGLIHDRKGLRLDPTGILAMDIQKVRFPLTQEVRNLLLQTTYVEIRWHGGSP